METVEEIRHEGIVKAVDVRAGTVTVSTEAGDGCNACPAAKLCGLSGDDKNTILVETKIAGAYREGDHVVVVGTETLHRKAIMLATVIPSIIMIATMVGIFLLTGSQLASVLCGLGIMVAFYVALYLCRNKIAHEFRFTIQKADIE